jgi:DNA-binding GntR family transcriptional regulator
MADNPYLMASLNRLLIDHTRMSQTFYQARAMVDQKRIKKACEQHDAMIEAIEAGEPSRAVELTLEHWDLSRGQIEKYVQPAPLPVEGITTDRERHRHAV